MFPPPAIPVAASQVVVVDRGEVVLSPRVARELGSRRGGAAGERHDGVILLAKVHPRGERTQLDRVDAPQAKGRVAAHRAVDAAEPGAEPGEGGRGASERPVSRAHAAVRAVAEAHALRQRAQDRLDWAAVGRRRVSAELRERLGRLGSLPRRADRVPRRRLAERAEPALQGAGEGEASHRVRKDRGAAPARRLGGRPRHEIAHAPLEPLVRPAAVQRVLEHEDELGARPAQLVVDRAPVARVRRQRRPRVPVAGAVQEHAGAAAAILRPPQGQGTRGEAR
mmetsp:Transcript_51472/g.168313  ORF Transcript_51472/g.168313 Transcript_51472/m.168313 type:complete len:281 (+) Transcript_51472:396-1238(+)